MYLFGYLIFPCLHLPQTDGEFPGERRNICTSMEKKNNKLNSLYLMPLIELTECFAYTAEYLLIADMW